MDSSNRDNLSKEALMDTVDLVLWAGQLLLQYGSETEKVEQAIHRLGDALGCDKLNTIIMHDAIILTVISGGEFRTKTKKVVRQGVNFTILSEVSKLSALADLNKFDRFKIREELSRIDKIKSNYNKFQIATMVGIACGSFSVIFGGGIVEFLITFIASFFGLLVRYELTHRYYNALMTTTLSAFTATTISGLAILFCKEPKIAFASSVLFLIPGVQLINSAEDLIKGHVSTGIARGFMGVLISLAISIGIMGGLFLIRVF